MRQLLLTAMTAALLAGLYVLPMPPLEVSRPQYKGLDAALQSSRNTAPLEHTPLATPAERTESRRFFDPYDQPDQPVIEAVQPETQAIHFSFTPDQRAAYQQINAAYTQEKWDEAAQLAEEFLKKWPKSPNMRRFTSNIYGNWGIQTHNRGRFMDAVKLLTRAVEIDASNPEYFVAIGMTSLNLMDIATAESSFRHVVQAFPQYGRGYFGLGEVAYRKHDLDTAKYYFELAIERGAGESHVIAKLRKTLNEMEVERRYRQLRSNHFVVSYEPSVGYSFAQWALGELEQGFTEIGQELGVRPNALVVVILNSVSDFTYTAGVPHWASAVYDGKIRMPIGPDSEFNRELYRKYLRHELTHALTAHASGNNCPTWLNEGLAQVFEGSTIVRGRHDVFLVGVRDNQLNSLADLETPFIQLNSHQLAQIAYDQSLAAVEYIRERYPRSAIQALLRRLRQGETLEDALKEITGHDYRSLLANIKGHYRREFRL